MEFGGCTLDFAASGDNVFRVGEAGRHEHFRTPGSEYFVSFGIVH